MASPLPPWLDVGPQSYLGAEEAGSRLGLARSQLQQRAIGGEPTDNTAAIAQQDIANQFRLQEMERQKQQDTLQQQQYEAQVKLQADQLARKYQAMQQYKSRIAGGEDPLKVLMELGPEAGLGASAEAAAIRSMYQKPRPARPIQMPEVQFTQVGDQKIPYLVDRMTGRATWLPSGYLGKTGKAGQLSESQREQAIIRLETLRDKTSSGAAYPQFIGADKPDPSWSDSKKAQFKAYKDSIDRIDKQIDRLERGEDQAPAEQQGPPAGAAGTQASLIYDRSQGKLVPAGGTQAAPAQAAPPTIPGPTAQPIEGPPSMKSHDIGQWFVDQATKKFGDPSVGARRLSDVIAREIGLGTNAPMLGVRLREGSDPLYRMSPGRAINQILAGTPRGGLTREKVVDWLDKLPPEKQIAMYAEALGVDPNNIKGGASHEEDQSPPSEVSPHDEEE